MRSGSVTCWTRVLAIAPAICLAGMPDIASAAEPEPPAATSDPPARGASNPGAGSGLIFRPTSRTSKLARPTTAMEIELPPGETHVVVEACDAAGSCTTETLAVDAETLFIKVVPTRRPAGLAGPRAPMARRPVIGSAKRQADVAADTELPVIQVTVPESVEQGETPRRITGYVADDGSPPRLTLDGKRVPLFRAKAGDVQIKRHTMAFAFDFVPRSAGEQRFVLEACDSADNCVAEQVVTKVVAINRPSEEGRNYALVIGADKYTYLPTLKTAVRDAMAVAKTLKEKYTFDDDAVRLLINADRNSIFRELAQFRKRLEENDRLLIYYAGHGQIDPVTEEGFWQPVDAVPDQDFTWIGNATLRRYLRGMPAKHVLVVVDSCFSGTLVRSQPPGNKYPKDRFFTEIDAHVSRKVITSGGTEPVADEGLNGHSIFAYYFLKLLNGNDKSYVTSFELFNSLVRAVTNNSSQKPNFGVIAEAGDEGAGDFTLILKN